MHSEQRKLAKTLKTLNCTKFAQIGLIQSATKTGQAWCSDNTVWKTVPHIHNSVSKNSRPIW